SGHNASRRGGLCGHRTRHRRPARAHPRRARSRSDRDQRSRLSCRAGTGERHTRLTLVGNYASRTILPAYWRDNSAVSASLARARGNTFAITGLSLPASHQLSNSERYLLISTGSRSACAPQTTPITDMFLTRIRLAGTV